MSAMRILAALVVACSIVSVSHDAHAAAYDTCKKLVDAGKSAKALDCFRDAAKKNPSDAKSGNAYGAMLAEKKDYAGALAAFEKVLAASPKNATAKNGKAMILLVQKKYDEGFALLEEALKESPDDLQLLQNCAILALESRKLDIAAGAFARVLAIDPAHAGAHAGLGETLLLAGKEEEAQVHFLAAIKKNDKDARSHWLMGKSLARTNPKLAVEYLERASFLAKNDAEVWYDLGITRRLIGEERLAGQALTQAQALAPAEPKILLELGKVHTAMNRFDMAAAHFEKVLEMKPDPALKASTHYHFALLREAEGKYKEAEAQYLQALRSAPDDVPSMLNLSRLYAGQKRWPDARRLLDTCAKLQPQNPAVRYNLGAVMMQQGDIEAGKAELKNLIASLKADDPLRGQAEEILRGARPDTIPTTPATKKP